MRRIEKIDARPGTSFEMVTLRKCGRSYWDKFGI